MLLITHTLAAAPLLHIVCCVSSTALSLFVNLAFLQHVSQSSVSTFSLGLRPLFIGFHKSLASFSGHVSTFCAFTGLWKWCGENDKWQSVAKKRQWRPPRIFCWIKAVYVLIVFVLGFKGKGFFGLSNQRFQIAVISWYLSCYTILSFWRVLSIVVTVHCAITITHMMGSKKLATFSSSNFFSWAKSGVQKLFPLFLLFAWLESIYLATASTSSSFRLLYCL